MRRSLYFFKDDILYRTQDVRGGLDENMVRTLIKLSSCQTEEAALQMLSRLGPVDMKEPVSLLKAYSKFALVAVGADAKMLWRQHDAKSATWLKFSRVFPFFCLVEGKKRRIKELTGQIPCQSRSVPYVQQD